MAMSAGSASSSSRNGHTSRQGSANDWIRWRPFQIRPPHGSLFVDLRLRCLGDLLRSRRMNCNNSQLAYCLRALSLSPPDCERLQLERRRNDIAGLRIGLPLPRRIDDRPRGSPRLRCDLGSASRRPSLRRGRSRRRPQKGPRRQRPFVGAGPRLYDGIAIGSAVDLYG